MERIIDRLDKFLKYKGITDNALTVKAGLSIGLIGKARKNGDLGKNSIEKILNVMSELNRVWLLTGTGEMLKNGEHGVAEAIPEYRTERSAKATDYQCNDLISAYKLLLKEKDLRMSHMETIIEEKDRTIKTLERIIEILKREETGTPCYDKK